MTVSDHFRKWRDEKVDALVVRSACPSQNVQSTQKSDHFWKLRCVKSGRSCGAKHISQSKCFWKLTCRKHARHCGVKRISKSTCHAKGLDDCFFGFLHGRRVPKPDYKDEPEVQVCCKLVLGFVMCCELRCRATVDHMWRDLCL